MGSADTLRLPAVATGIPRFGIVKYYWPEHYALVTWPDGSTQHSGPWKSQWAANRLVEYWRLAWRRWMSRRDDVGNGNTCPLYPDHGNMFVLNGSVPPMQYCANQMHDGAAGKAGQQASRNRWPLHGFESSVATYNARLDQAIRVAGLDDLSDLEVSA